MWWGGGIKEDLKGEFLMVGVSCFLFTQVMWVFYAGFSPSTKKRAREIMIKCHQSQLQSQYFDSQTDSTDNVNQWTVYFALLTNQA